jgi:hypothetical protein
LSLQKYHNKLFFGSKLLLGFQSLAMISVVLAFLCAQAAAGHCACRSRFRYGVAMPRAINWAARSQVFLLPKLLIGRFAAASDIYHFAVSRRCHLSINNFF